MRDPQIDAILQDVWRYMDDERHRFQYLQRIEAACEALKQLPKEPPAGLLYSMALRYRHDFGLDKVPEDSPVAAGCTPEEREAILATMRQLYEEVSGHGFFKW